MAQYGFYFNAAGCIGCKTCVLACKDENDVGLGMLLRRVYDYEYGSVDERDGVLSGSPSAYYVSVGCNHCANPTCVEMCPTGACSKDEDTGIVSIDPDVCIGCQTCVKNCPYGAPAFDENRSISVKCEACADRRAAGEPVRCVASCPMRVLEFGDLEELKRVHGDLGADVAPLPSPDTVPSLLIDLHPAMQDAERLEGESVSFSFEFGN